jgi:preprotein translocase subunit YajC
MSLLFADTPAAASAAAASAAPEAQPSMLENLLHSPLPVMIVIFALFWFLFIRPQQKQQKEREAQLKALQPGDKVVLVSGVHATVSKVEEGDLLKLEIAEGVVVKAQRTAVDRKLV